MKLDKAEVLNKNELQLHQLSQYLIHSMSSTHLIRLILATDFLTTTLLFAKILLQIFILQKYNICRPTMYLFSILATNYLLTHIKNCSRGQQKNKNCTQTQYPVTNNKSYYKYYPYFLYIKVIAIGAVPGYKEIYVLICILWLWTSTNSPHYICYTSSSPEFIDAFFWFNIL